MPWTRGCGLNGYERDPSIRKTESGAELGLQLYSMREPTDSVAGHASHLTFKCFGKFVYYEGAAVFFAVLFEGCIGQGAYLDG